MSAIIPQHQFSPFEEKPFELWSPDDEEGSEEWPDWEGGVVPREPMLIEDLICRTGLTTIFGKGASLKTWMSLSMAVHVAAGRGTFYNTAQIERHGKVVIYSVEDTHERIDRRLRAIIEFDLRMKPNSPEAKAVRNRIRVLAPLGQSKQQFPFSTGCLFDDENEYRYYAPNQVAHKLVGGISKQNAGRDPDDTDRVVMLLIDSVTSTAGADLTKNKESGKYTWFFNQGGISDDYAVLAIAHTPKTTDPNPLAPEEGRDSRMAGGFGWSTNIRASIEVRRPLGPRVERSRTGTIKKDEWFERQGLPAEHSRAIVMQVAKENVGLSDQKLWFSPRRIGKGAFEEITDIMKDKPRSWVEYLERSSREEAAKAPEQNGKARALVEDCVRRICHDGTKLTANAVQTLAFDESIWGAKIAGEAVGLKKNATRNGVSVSNSSAGILQALADEGVLIKGGSDRMPVFQLPDGVHPDAFAGTSSLTDRLDVTNHAKKGDDLKKARGFVLKYANDLFARGEEVTALAVSQMMEQAAYEVGLLSSGHNGCKGAGSVDGHLRQLAAERLLVASGTGRIVYSLPNGATPESLSKGSNNE
ncbi:MAG: AAA family ATPase [Erythrobacter sp.]|nr:AAA family ATPase [Erythrobacter sp.]